VLDRLARAARRIGTPNLALLAAILVALLLLTLRHDPDRGIEVQRLDPPSGVDEIRVSVTGAVARPGVLTAQPGDRVLDLVERAGGLTSEADPAAVNLALRVRDEDHVHIPALGDGPPLLDLNAASATDLEALPGIGPVYAGRIIEARAQLPFASSDDLLERDVIPAHTYDQIRDLVTAVAP
jgi:competence protein ComEA